MVLDSTKGEFYSRAEISRVVLPVMSANAYFNEPLRNQPVIAAFGHHTDTEPVSGCLMMVISWNVIIRWPWSLCVYRRSIARKSLSVVWPQQKEMLCPLLAKPIDTKRDRYTDRFRDRRSWRTSRQTAVAGKSSHWMNSGPREQRIWHL